MFTRTWTRHLFARPPRTIRKEPARCRPRLEALEDRLAPATFMEAGTTLNLVLSKANTNVSLVSAGTSYTLTLTGDTWSGTDDAGKVTGNGNATLTVTPAVFTTQISLTDSA